MNDAESTLFPQLGATRPLVIAGPCSAETPEQLMTTANELAAAGIKVFRAGLWKPRTKPGCFEGVGSIGLEWMQAVKRETGMLLATEVANRAHTEKALAAGIDMLWLGARTSANPFAVQEIADTLAEHDTSQVTVMVKNPVNPDLDLWIGALQRVRNAGIRRLGAIHRGFSTYGRHIYRNMPEWHIAIELRLRYPSLPIICDPSHIGGKRELIAPLAQQAMDMGFDGLIIESHCNPVCAWSDAEQQITPAAIRSLLDKLVVRDSQLTTESLTLLRRQIDSIDNDLLEVLGRRMAVSREIGRYKRLSGMPVVQARRYNDVIRTRIRLGEEMGMSPDFLRTVLLAIHDESVRQQIDELDSPTD